jgi:hypothetical protein
MNRPCSPPPNTQPSVLAWQGSPNHELRAQILAAARNRTSSPRTIAPNLIFCNRADDMRCVLSSACLAGPKAFYPTQRPPSPPPVRAVPQQLKPRRTSSTKSNSSAGCASSLRRPRHNGSTASSTCSASSLLSARSTNALGGPAANAVASGSSRAALADKPAVVQPNGIGTAALRPSSTTTGDENSWNLAQILSEVDARMAARRGNSFQTVAPLAAAPAHRTAKGKGRALQRSVSADRLPFHSSAGRTRKFDLVEANALERRLDDVAEHPRPIDLDRPARPPVGKRLKRSTSSGTAPTRRRSRSPSWEVEEPSSGSAYDDDGIDWQRTVELLTPPAVGVPDLAPSRLQPAPVLPTSLHANPAPSPHALPAAAQQYTRSPPKARGSPQKRKVPPSPLKQTTSMDYSTSSPTVSHLALSQDRASSSQTGCVRLGMGRAASIVTGGSRLARFRPPFKPPSQVAAPAQPASVHGAKVCASPRPPIATQPVVMGDEPADEDTSFDSFDGMLASLEGSGQLNEVYRLLDGG